VTVGLNAIILDQAAVRRVLRQKRLHLLPDRHHECVEFGGEPTAFDRHRPRSTAVVEITKPVPDELDPLQAASGGQQFDRR
jgi:hypothetical protein